MQQHPYARILRAIADGETIQSKDDFGDWVSRGPATVLEEISDHEHGPEHYRVKPRTITINSHEVPEPLREAPEQGTDCWTPHLSAENPALFCRWNGDNADHRWLARGLVHLTREAAQAHAEALISITASK